MVLAAIIVAGDPPVETLSEWPHRDQRVDAAVMTDRVAALLAGAVDIEPCALRDVSHLAISRNEMRPPTEAAIALALPKPRSQCFQ
jgi:hypothetical protein